MKQLHYKTITGLPHGSGTCELEMRVYKSDVNAQDLKPLLALHGGTWRHRGFSFFGLEAGISQFTERGFVVFAPFYRLVGESDGNTECNGASWREVTADVASALDWIKANGSALGASNDRINLFGQSAGAHLAAWLASHRPNDVWKTMMFYAPTDALEFLAGAVPPGGPFDSYRRFGVDSLAQYFGAHNGSDELLLEQINFAGLTVPLLNDDWQTLIPDTVFNISQINPLDPPLYVAGCATATQTELSAINLSMPPTTLTLCMKQELSEFLIDNSFIHQLKMESVPIHILQGSGDTLVPYQQALSLCGAIDNSVLPVGVFAPLTSYDCGQVSQLQIVKDAEHALELGVCLGSICPAGEPGSPVNDAATTALQTAYNWLDEDVYIFRETPIKDPPPKDQPGPIWFTDNSSASNEEPATAQPSAGAFDWLTLLAMLLMHIRRLRARKIMAR
jgi:acetyl esterase/lipase